MSRHDTDRRGPVHTLIVSGVDEEQGIDYEVKHPDDCTLHHVTDGAMSYSYYDCGVQHVFDDEGIEGVFTHLDKPIGAVGEIRIVAVWTYDTYTHESDLWIEEA